MKSCIDMDSTIQNLLKTYATYAESVLDKDAVRIASKKFRNPNEKEEIVKGYYRARQAYEFLKLVEENPQKYLYYSFNIIYNGIDNGGNPGVQYGRPSVYDKLEAVDDLITARTNLNALFQLSENISNHILVSGYKPGDKWVYYGNSDFYAEKILELNKKVCLMGKSDFVRPFVDIVPAHRFATLLYSKRSR